MALLPFFTILYESLEKRFVKKSFNHNSSLGLKFGARTMLSLWFVFLLSFMTLLFYCHFLGHSTIFSCYGTWSVVKFSPTRDTSATARNTHRIRWTMDIEGIGDNDDPR